MKSVAERCDRSSIRLTKLQRIKQTNLASRYCQVILFSKHVQVITLCIELFIQQVEFFIVVIQFHTFAIEIST